MSMATTTRNASIADLAEMLKDQHARKVDMVVPAAKIRSEEGLIVVKGAEAVIDADGVTQADGVYRPTVVFDEGIADKLGIPLAYVRRLRESRPDVLDANVNGWLHGRKAKGRWNGIAGDPDAWVEERAAIPGDDRKFLLRTFRSDDGVGVGRAFLSDRYKLGVDNLDVVTAALKGIEQAGVDAVVEGCDLTDRRMFVRVVAPQVQVVAERLLKDYRAPFGNDEIARWRDAADREGLGYGGNEPILFAGFEIGNSEVGNGAFSLTPRMVVQICGNGLKISKDLMRKTHIGSRLDEGTIDWSQRTETLSLELITSQTADAVAQFLTTGYMEEAVAALEEAAGVEIRKPEEQIKTIGKRLKFDEATIDGVLAHFIRGGQMTAGGVMQAVSSYAQVVGDADKAADLEGAAVRVLEVAASL